MEDEYLCCRATPLLLFRKQAARTALRDISNTPCTDYYSGCGGRHRNDPKQTLHNGFHAEPERYIFVKLLIRPRSLAGQDGRIRKIGYTESMLVRLGWLVGFSAAVNHPGENPVNRRNAYD